MSLFGAMNTAISGLAAQSNSFGNISDNVANAQTVGYKRVDTNFTDYLTTSNGSVNDPGAVVARPFYVNNVQGTVTQSDNPLGLAIAGQGFFAVSQKTGEANNIPTFSPQKYDTRAGDFQMDKNGFLVNSANEALNGWPVNPVTGLVNQNTLAPIQVTQTVFNPQATTTVTLSANLPATPAVGTATPTIYYTTPEANTAAAAAASSTAAAAKAAAPGAINPAAVADAQTATDDAAAAVAAAAAAILPGATAATVAAALTSPPLSVSAAASAAATAVSAAALLAGATPNVVVNVAVGIASSSAATAAGSSLSAVAVPAFVAGNVKTPASPISSAIDVYDALGTVHTVTLNWVKNIGSANNWTVNLAIPSDPAFPAVSSANVTFGDPTVVPPALPGPGTVAAVGAGTGGVVATSGPFVANTQASLTLDVNFGSGVQTIQLNLGTYGQSDGVTQYAGTQYTLRGLTQNGVPPGAFSSVTTQVNGNIVVNYDNGQNRTIAQVPLVTFNNPNQLQRQDGQAFTATLESGTPLAEQASTNGAGNLVTQSVESSNVDIATEFSKLIVAQRAYSANTKMVTTADDLLQQTIDMKR